MQPIITTNGDAQTHQRISILRQLLEKKRTTFLTDSCMDIDRLTTFIQSLNHIIRDHKTNATNITASTIEAIHSFQFTKTDGHGNDEQFRLLLKSNSDRDNNCNYNTNTVLVDMYEGNRRLFESISTEIQRLQSIVHQLSVHILRAYETEIVANETSIHFAGNLSFQTQFKRCYRTLYEIELFPLAVNKIIAEYYVCSVDSCVHCAREWPKHVCFNCCHVNGAADWVVSKHNHGHSHGVCRKDLFFGKFETPGIGTLCRQCFQNLGHFTTTTRANKQRPEFTDCTPLLERLAH